MGFTVGKWNQETCDKFYELIAKRSVSPTPQNKICFCTDGNSQNKNAMLKHFLPETINYGMRVKDKIDQRVVGSHVEIVFGNMHNDEVAINNVDGLCSALRERVKCAVRRGKAFAKKKKTVSDLLEIYQSYHNLVEVKSGQTPCMRENLTAHVWKFGELLNFKVSVVY